MNHTTFLIDAARRPVSSAAQVLRGIDREVLHACPGGRGNSVAWLVWHAARQMDAQLASLTGRTQIWTAAGWADRLGVPRGPGEIGFGDTPEQAAALTVSDPDLLLVYLTDVVDALVAAVSGWSADDLDVVVDTAWDPPVTRGVRLVSLIDDAVAHLGQAAYARGLVEGWTIGY